MKPAIPICELLDCLEAIHGKQEPSCPIDPYEFLVWWHCGYPASDERCTKGWAALRADVGTGAEILLKTPTPKLVSALKAGGMVPELRAIRLKEIANRVINEFGGDLWTGLRGDAKAIRKVFKSFPNIGNPGADRIMLFAAIAPVAAIPSNCPHVLVRITEGAEHENYSLTYKDAQRKIDEAVKPTIEARTRAFLLLKAHGQKVCKLTNPHCSECGVRQQCAYVSGKTRGRSTPVGKRRSASG
jgi:endonuclease III